MSLALYGGNPVIQDSSLHRDYPVIGFKEKQYVLEALSSGELWGPFAPKTRELEKRWAKYVGTDFCVAMNSGTAALHSAVVAAGVGPGDHVIVPAYTFIASASCALMAGAVPVFCDINPQTMNMSAGSLEEAITPQTKAVIPVHLFGLPASMDQIMEVAEKNNLVVIEDCSQAHGARSNGRNIGTFGLASTFSLNASKTLAGPEGGLLNTSDPDLLNRAAAMRVFGAKWEEGQLRERDADCLGYNYRTNELCAAFALAQLESFEDQTEARIQNAHLLIDGLSGLEGIDLPPRSSDRSHIYQMFRIGINPAALQNEHLSLTQKDAFRSKVIEALRAEGCKWSAWEKKPLPAYNLFQTKNEAFGSVPWAYGDEQTRNMTYDPDRYPSAQSAAASSLCTTAHYPQNDARLMALYIEAFQKVWEQRETLFMDSQPG